MPLTDTQFKLTSDIRDRVADLNDLVKEAAKEGVTTKFDTKEAAEFNSPFDILRVNISEQY